MTSHSLVPQPPALRLPVAQMRNVLHPGDVERKLARLQESGNQREYETLRTVYERMLERGPERFQVKPSGIPDMASLYEQLPNFTEVLDDVKRHVALAQDSSDGLEVTPMLLLGPPGIGKTHFARHLAELLGTGMNLLPMSSMTAGWLLSGSSAQWKGARPGKVFEALVEGEYANPVIVVDEIDKASSDAQYDPLGALYSLLEYDTAQSFTDEFDEVAIDASQVIWITTANDTRGIPDPILNRMNVFEVEAPTLEQARTIARNLYQGIRAGHDWGRLLDPEPTDDVLDHLAQMPPREMRRALMTGFGNARLERRATAEIADLPRGGQGRTRSVFVKKQAPPPQPGARPRDLPSGPHPRRPTSPPGVCTPGVGACGTPRYTQSSGVPQRHAPSPFMALSQSLFVIGLLIAASAFFSMAEISLAAARRLRLRQMADEGDARADQVLRMQEQPGDYFTVVQVGQNAVAILGGIVGEGALSPHFTTLFGLWLSESAAQKAGFLASFLVITSDDILAMMEAGARAGVLAAREQQVITNVFELDTRMVSSAMSPRDRVAFFLRDEPDSVIRLRIAAEPFSTYPVCEGDIDNVVGYVDAKDLFQRVLNNHPISLADDSLVRKVLIVPDRLTLSEVLEQFRQVHEDFAVIVNECSLVVGVVTLNDVMSTVMGDLVGPADEEQIVRRDENSWLIDGVTPVEDVLRALS